MTPTPEQQEQLRSLPGVDHLLTLLQQEPDVADVPKSVKVRAVRQVLETMRSAILNKAVGPIPTARIIADVKRAISVDMTPNLLPAVNATGVVIHTNLGRSLLAPAAMAGIAAIGASYSNLELNLATGRRGIRYSAVEPLLCEITGAEAAMAVNNNAGAVLLCLDTLAKGKDVIVSRGELVEIGGSFRVPDIMAKSGGRLREIGTTNRTHLRDYEQAIGDETGLLLKVHTSNFSLVGFTASVSLAELVGLGKQTGIPVMEDLGSGTFIDFSDYGLIKEPTVQESVAAGVDVVTFSGDKLLGGPQAGIIVGKQAVLDRVKKNPLTRALRIDKLTLASLEATLRLYRDPRRAVAEIPTLRMLLAPQPAVAMRAERLIGQLDAIDDRRLKTFTRPAVSKVGGGSIPSLELPSQCVVIQIEGMSANDLEKAMRGSIPPVIGRIEDDRFCLDARTIQDNELDIVSQAAARILRRADK